MKWRLYLKIALLIFLPIITGNYVHPGIDRIPGYPFMQNFPPKQTGGHFQNFDIIQDNRGIIYVGNGEGLLEFDGSKWRLTDIADNSRVKSLAKDKNGKIYLGLEGDIGFLALDSKGKTIYKSLTGKQKDKDYQITDLGQILPTAHDGIYFFDYRKIFRLHNGNLNLVHRGPISRANCLFQDKPVFFEQKKGLYIIEKGKLQFLPGSEAFADKSRLLLLPYSAGKLLILADSDFYIFDIETSLRKKGATPLPGDRGALPSPEKFTTEIDAFLKLNFPSCCLKMDDRHFAFGTKKAGIVIMNREGKLVRIINKALGLYDNYVSGLSMDKDNNLWASLNKGIATIETSSPISRFTDLNGIEGSVLALVKYNGSLYAGTYNGGVSCLPSPATQPASALQEFNFITVQETEPPSFALLSIEQGILASGPQSIYHIRGTTARKVAESGNIYCFGSSPKFPQYVFVGLTDGCSVMEVIETDKDDKNKNLPGKGIRLIEKGKFKEITAPIRAIKTDREGNLFLGTENKGLVHIIFEGNDVFKYKMSRYGLEHGLPKSANNEIYYVGDRLIVTNESGIYKAVKTGSGKGTGQFKFEPDPAFKQICTGDIGLTILNTENGDRIQVLSTELGYGQLIRNRDGVYDWLNLSFKKISGYPGAIIMEPNGIIWLAASEGLFHYDSTKKKDYKKTFHALIRKVTVTAEEQEIIFYGNNYRDSGKKEDFYTIPSLDQPRQLIRELPYAENSLTFEFSAAYYESIEANRFSYVLEGFDRQWSQWTAETKKEYTNLPPGDYKFRVKARNIFNVYSSEATYRFSIATPWYRTGFVYIGQVAALLLLIYGAIAIYSRRLKTAKSELEQIVKERTAALELQKEELKKQAEQLEAGNKELEKLSIVADRTDNAVMIMDAEANFEWINQGFTRMFGDTLEQLIARRGRNLRKASLNPKIREALDTCIREKKTIRYEAKVTVDSTGKTIWVQTTLTPIVDWWGKVRKLVAIDSDISKLKESEVALKKANKTAKQAREKAEMANRSKSEFLARMSHEIRTPMNGVIGFTEMLLDTRLSDEQKDFALTISKSGEALINLLNDILDFSKIEAGELSFDPIIFDPEVTLFDVCDIIRPRIGGKQIELLCRIGDNVPSLIKSDAGRFRQVVTNLMGNAAKFTEAGEVELSLDVEKEEKDKFKLHIKVRDTGIGIPADKLENIFNPFRQAEDSTAREYGGTGLGLAICKQIAEMMGGKVWAESEGGKGSTFHFTAWVDRVEETKADDKPVSYDRLAGKKALLVDDNKTNLEILSHQLKNVGMHVVQTSKPEEAIKIVRKNYDRGETLDIGVIDIRMPGMSGHELAEGIRKLELEAAMPRLPLLAFSSSTLERSRKYKDSGFCGYLPKPIQRLKLLRIMSRMLGKKEATSQETKKTMVTQYTIMDEVKHSVHILLAEDNAVNRKLARNILTKAGYSLSVADNGEDAVKAYSEDPGKFNLIFMDIRMPGINGLEATRQIRELEKTWLKENKKVTRVPIIAMTADISRQDRKKCLEAGMDDHIPKPLKRDIIFEKVKTWCLDKLY